MHHTLKSTTCRLKISGSRDRSAHPSRWLQVILLSLLLKKLYLSLLEMILLG
ncbi:hypothetical protein AXF42_Ash010929 [Apostasia shenzhenica]|uniref:Uncharacterized protein n=1 Tax=Apostasia shenzhenica TaxID=1088818 RepID=A0A2H9ZQM3_9ASPA|nr:hypothetical protein AXF42_Ash010929 [Apostasia shenzhenica]